MEEIRLGNINKKGLLKKELPKGDIGGTLTNILRLLSGSI